MGLSREDEISPLGRAFLCPLAAGALANNLKLTAFSLWAFPAQVLTGASS